MNTLNIASLIASISTFHIIDLTHTIDEKTSVWDGSCGFTSELTSNYKDGGFRGHKFTMKSCLGTHMDTPAHCFSGAEDCSTISIENCVVPACVIDITKKAHEDYCISVEDIQEFEKLYGEIKPNSLIFFSTGWSKRWDNPEQFRNVKSDGVAHFPYVSEESAKFLLNRNVIGIGVDTFSPDAFYLQPHVHKLFLGASKYIIENVANLENMPPTNSYVIALPLKISGAAESPIRLIGLINKKTDDPHKKESF